MLYEIYQIQVSDEIHDYVNSNEGGHTGAAKKYPLYHAKMETMHGRGEGRKVNFKTEYFSHYTKVCEVDGRFCGLKQGDSVDYTVTSKNEVFSILNQCYLDEDTGEDIVFDNHVSGYTMKSFVRDGKTIEYRNMHSLSVGDIIAEVPQVGYEVMDPSDIVKHTTYHMVDSYGFSDITSIISSTDIAVNRIAEAV